MKNTYLPFLIFALLACETRNQAGQSLESDVVIDTTYHVEVDTMTEAEKLELALKPVKTSSNNILKALKPLKKISDEFNNTEWYYAPNGIRRTNTNQVVTYIGKEGSSIWLSFHIAYRGNDWLFVQNCKIITDESKYEVYPSEQVERDNNSDVWEWFDENMTPSYFAMLEDISTSKKAKIRYNGKTYYHDRIISQKEKQAIGVILKAYKEATGNTTYPG